jgi:hypothetical protein
MSDDSGALATIPPAPTPSEQDYEAILGAVVETARGRWFLDEYARRNRYADTRQVLDAIERIEARLRGDTATPHERVRFDLIEMAKAIARTRAEIAAIKPDAEHDGKIGAASVELDAIVRATESATSDVLAAAEQIQEIAWTMREADSDPAVCDQLDARATEIYTACSFQDLTGQRIHKVIDVLHYLEQRINAMIAIWGDADVGAPTEAKGADGFAGSAAAASAGLDQADVDMVLHLEPGRPAGIAEHAEPEAGSSGEDDDAHGHADGDTVTFVQFTQQEDPTHAILFVGHDAEATLVRSDAKQPPAVAGLAMETVDVAMFGTEIGSHAVTPHPASDPLADVRALSDEEKIALCR